jgi:hypothetical protein
MGYAGPERSGKTSAAAYDPDVQKRLWELSLELTGAPDVT